jgi:hypothetical protein
MSILAKYNAAMEAKDEAAMNEILHDDYKFTMHASGNVLGKADVIKWAMSGDIKRDKIRVLLKMMKSVLNTHLYRLMMEILKR